VGQQALLLFVGWIQRLIWVKPKTSNILVGFAAWTGAKEQFVRGVPGDLLALQHTVATWA